MKPIFSIAPSLLTSIAILCGCQSSPSPDAASRSSSAQLAGTANGTTAPRTSYAVPDSLTSLNQLFLDAYKERQALVKSNTSPLIVAYFGELTLHWNGVVETTNSIPAICTALKDIAHVPFGIFLRIDPCTRSEHGRLPAIVVSRLKSCQENIRAAEVSLTNAGFSPEQMVRQRLILDDCRNYLTKVVVTGKVTRDGLLEFAHKVSPLMLANADDAAAAQLDLTHAVVMGWKKRIPPDEWKRLVVVVRGFQMPRRLNIQTQYFARVLNEPGHGLGYPLESRRLIYAEFIMNNRDHLDLMATTFIDGDASEAFFGDRWRMSRDVLADGAKAYLKRLKFD